MSAPDQVDPLVAALGEIHALGADPDREAVAELRDRLANQRLRVLVAGEAKRGKSTLVNALLGRAILPAGVTPLTALATTVRYGTDEGVTVWPVDGGSQRYLLGEIGDFVTERGNPNNSRNLRAVTADVNCPLLARGLELVDTPGTGSVHGHNTTEADAALRTMDAAVFVLSADPPVSASERDLIARVARLSVTMFVVLNKADRLTADELREVLDFTADVASRAAGTPVEVHPISARAALDGTGDRGFTGFLTAFTSYLDRNSRSDLRRAIVAHARRIASALRDEVVLAQTAASARGTDAEDRVRAFTARLAAVRDRRRDAADLAAAQSRRMLADLNESTERTQREAAGRVLRQITDLLDDALAGAPAAEIERTGRAMLTELAVAEAEAWRGRRTDLLESGLARIDETLTQVLRAELAAIRQAAADLLGLNLAVALPGQRLAPDLRFFYQVAEQVGQTELLAGAIRRHLPGRAGSGRAAAHLRRETGDLVTTQFGRARADLQYRLGEATRKLLRIVDDRYQEGTGRLERALADAERARGATAREVAVRDRQLTERLAAIDHVLSLLETAGPDEVADPGLADPGLADAPA